MAISREEQLATATPENRQPKWYHYLFVVAAIGFFVWGFWPGNEYMHYVALVPLVILLGLLGYNYWVNGNAFDDRAAGR